MNHWTETDFQHWLYGLKEADAHAEGCAQCRSELERLAEKRRGMVAEPEVSQEFLARQRRSIHRRLEAPRLSRMAMRWALSMALLLVMIAGLTLGRWRKPEPAISDEQLFSDLSAMEQSAEPKAIQPIHGLFEE